MSLVPNLTAHPMKADRHLSAEYQCGVGGVGPCELHCGTSGEPWVQCSRVEADLDILAEGASHCMVHNSTAVEDIEDRMVSARASEVILVASETSAVVPDTAAACDRA